MKSIDSRLRKLLGHAPKHYFDDKIASHRGYWGERLISQLVFAHELSKVQGGRHAALIERALTFAEERIEDEGFIARQAALQAEGLLGALAHEAKSYEILCVAHAHIDMNWMWSWDETVSIVIDTFRTMLNLMNEYPDFTFSQSQASIYRIVEKHAPDMLAEIKERVREGRWEVTASHWVEADKNMPSGESLSRHLLYTKRYLARLFDLDPDGLNLDFEPDTFGHSVHVPEILANGGVGYYYHCRGNDEQVLYRWVAPSGKSVIAYREPTWYNDYAQAALGSYVPEIGRRTGLKTYLNVYGVGDHGGGPTRRDLERLKDMNDWPIYPRIRFGTYAEYFKQVESIADKLPVVTGEQNFVFTGCYTSQSRIKTANRAGEAALNEAETFASAASVATGIDYPSASFEEAWRDVLFNQFHDILPGSGVLETREHALGLFQNAMAIAGTNRKLALEAIAASIDTSGLGVEDDKRTISEGAGVGFGASEFMPTQVERGRGSTRIVHFFNPSAHDREETAEIVLWDWNEPGRSPVVRDSGGNETPHQVVDQGFNKYWGHRYMRLLIQAKAPACGYSTYTVSEGDEAWTPFLPTDPRVDRVEAFELENERLRVTFHPANATIVSMIDKTTGEQLVDPSRPAGLFRLIQEDPGKGMSSWWVGRYMNVSSVHENVKLKWGGKGPVRQTLQYELEFGRSKLKVAVSLDRGSSRLNFRAECDWHEIGTADSSIPQLNFHWPLGYECDSYQYDVPFGTTERGPLDMDVPANSWAIGLRRDSGKPGKPGKPSLMLVTNNKYGFRGTDRSLSLSLIRSSYDPDPYPELGNHHRMSFAIDLVDPTSSVRERIEKAYRFNHPFSALSGTPHPGALALDSGFLKLTEGTVAVSAVKMPEDREGKRWIVRAYETDGRRTTASLLLFAKPTAAYFVDTNERRISSAESVCLDDRSVSFDVEAYSAATICVEFQ